MSTLVVLAGGFGSRFGGPKQFFPVGPNDECLLHYSLYDAQQAGFEHFLLLTREELMNHVTHTVEPLLNGKLKLDVAFQECPGGKAKGTAHALLSTRGKTNGSIGLVNSDDYYGPYAYKKLDMMLDQHSQSHSASLVAYPLRRTLSDIGGVNRALIHQNPDGTLKQIEELYDIEDLGSIHGRTDTEVIQLRHEDLVSLNMFGFTPDIYDSLESFCRRTESETPGKEMLLPTWLNQEIEQNNWTGYVTSTDTEWFGMTFVEEMEMVRLKLHECHASGVYPERLW